MQEKETNIKVIWDDNTNFYGIAFILKDVKTIEAIKKINHCFIKYHGTWSLTKNDNNTSQIPIAYVIKFDNMPKNLLDSVCETIKNKVINENLSEDKALKAVLDLFKKEKFKKEFKEMLIGDIGEAIFMINAKKLGINADEKIRKSDEHLYDFIFNEFYVEVKSSSKNLNEVIIDYRQISESYNRKFVVAKFQLLENQLNICDLYKILNSHNELVCAKEKIYSYIFEDERMNNILKENTIILENAECFILEDIVIPKIKIEHEGGLKKLKCYLGITNVNKIPLTFLKDK